MKAKLANSSCLDILGNGDRSSAQEVLTATLKRGWQTVGYCSMFAAIPAMLVSQIPGARADEPEKPKVNIPGRPASVLEKPNKNRSNLALLKRQSKFLLPHQKGNFAMLAAVAENDDCPGQALPGGNYPAAAPFITSGDTTGANNTVTSLYYYYYYTFGAYGPDHVYRFTITARGPNPQIEVSTTSGTYKPLIYVLDGGSPDSCPAGTGNTAFNTWLVSDSRWTPGKSTATLNKDQLNWLPLNVPLYLFVDSSFDDSTKSGPYTIRMQDVTIGPACGQANPIDCAEFFITQQYQDFLQRSPEAGPDGIYGTADDPMKFYLDIINRCSPTDDECKRFIRGVVSANFFRSPEFQRKGNYVMYLYMVSIGQRPVTAAELPTKNDPALNDRPTYPEFMADLASISTPNDDPVLTEQKKNDLANNWMTRPQIVSIYGGLSNAQFVQKLIDVSGVTPANQNWVAELNAGSKTRAQVLRLFAESPEVDAQFEKQSFVTMEYFGYLRRKPEDCHDPANWGGSDPGQCGFIFHNHRFTLVSDPHVMQNIIVRGFIESPEYRRRFGP